MSDSTTSPAGIPSPTDPAIAAAVARWVAAADPRDPAGALSAVVARVSAANGLDVALAVDGRPVSASPAVAAVRIDDAVLCTAGPWLPGFVREALVAREDRQGEGIHHTAPDVGAALVAIVAGRRPLGDADVVVDPAVGGGVLLLAAAAALDGTRAERVARLRGMDVDPLAVATTRAALSLWAGGAPVRSEALVVGDALVDPWPSGATVVIGNPPFRSQLRDRTVRDAARRRALLSRWPELGGYVDDAAAFLLAAVDHVDDGGVVALIQPASFLATRDGRSVRDRLAREAPPVALWIDGGRRFAASVDTIALVVQKGSPTTTVARFRGVPPRALGARPVPASTSWSPLLVADAPAIDPARMRSGRTLGDVAHLTAGFRDQFYGLRPAVREASTPGSEGGHPVRLITSGLIDPLHCRWGEVPCRFDKRRWDRPTVDPSAVEPSIATWVRDRLVPKLLVASQTRVLEAIVDRRGHMLPCTPVVTVEPLPGAPSLDHLAAALTAPVASLLLLHDAAGTALSPEAMRVSARTLGGLPLPPEGPAWDRAAEAVGRLDDAPSPAAVEQIATLAMAAYGLDDRGDIVKWWHSRRPGR